VADDPDTFFMKPPLSRSPSQSSQLIKGDRSGNRKTFEATTCREAAAGPVEGVAGAGHSTNCNPVNFSCAIFGSSFSSPIT